MTDAAFEMRVTRLAQQLLERCQSEGWRVAGDGSVSECVAGMILGYTNGETLADQVREHGGFVPYWRRGNRRMYRLTDLARHIEENFTRT